MLDGTSAAAHSARWHTLGRAGGIFRHRASLVAHHTLVSPDLRFFGYLLRKIRAPCFTSRVAFHLVHLQATSHSKKPLPENQEPFPENHHSPYTVAPFLRTSGCGCSVPFPRYPERLATIVPFLFLGIPCSLPPVPKASGETGPCDCGGGLWSRAAGL